MLALRIVFGLLLAVGLACFATYMLTGNPVWRQRGLMTIKWTVIAGLGAAVVIVMQTLWP
jgi:hypothetical protein